MTDGTGHVRVTARAGIDPVEQLRCESGASVVMVVDPAIGATAATMARSAIPAVALERAPHTRINAVAPGDQVDPAAIERVVAFLHRSPAITGQVLDLT